MKLTVSDVTFSYNSSLSLDGVSFELQESQILGIIGPNGSGKTTLLKCINKILKPKSGSIILNDNEIQKMSRLQIAKHVGYVPQNSVSPQALTVFEIVLMGRRPHIAWQSSQKDVEKTWQVLALLGIEHLALRNFNELSGGEQQRALIARSVAQEAKVLLLDEPTSNLDIKHQLEVMELAHELVTKQKLAAVVAIHDLNLASRYCDKIVMMKNGKIFAAGNASSVLTPDGIQSVYGVEVTVNYHNKIANIIPIKPIAAIN
ncbi:MAG: ABC transporter ATP-binding protein [Candidatus Bathyarchaeota archaeon]|nr:ABC transporter ATP-binding protein [Candidatus Bathyarchaeum sp.]